MLVNIERSESTTWMNPENTVQRNKSVTMTRYNYALKCLEQRYLQLGGGMGTQDFFLR